MKKKKILVVDDDEFVLGVIENALKDHTDYISVCVKNGDQALKKATDIKFDLIITDILMPEKDGIEFITEFRKQDTVTPIIVISGGSEGQEANNYINFAGYFACETLIKPFSKNELLHATEMALKNQHGDVLQFL